MSGICCNFWQEHILKRGWRILYWEWAVKLKGLYRPCYSSWLLPEARMNNKDDTIPLVSAHSQYKILHPCFNMWTHTTTSYKMYIYQLSPYQISNARLRWFKMEVKYALHIWGSSHNVILHYTHTITYLSYSHIFLDYVLSCILSRLTVSCG